MLRYVENIVIPFINKKRKQLKLSPSHKALVIFDVYKAHRDQKIFTLLEENNIFYRFVPASCTGKLQPLDADGGVNFKLKHFFKQEVTLWYGKQIAEALNEGKEIGEINIDLKLLSLKPLHANWFLSAFDQLSNNK